MGILDALNIRGSILSIDEFFDEIEALSKENIMKRKKFAFEMEDILLFIFALFQTMKEHKYIKKKYIKEQLQSKYIELVKKYGIDVDSDLLEYIEKFSDDTINTTLKNGNTPYFTSDDRAVLIAENESQNTFNRQDFRDAINSGKKRKQWIDINDDKERETHREAGGMDIPIKDYFLVGDSLLLYPHDYSMNPEPKEVINCRCSIRYF